MKNEEFAAQCGSKFFILLFAIASKRFFILHSSFFI